MVSIGGYPLEVWYCPSCGSENVRTSTHWNDGTGLVICDDCGQRCYVVEGKGDEEH